MRLEAAQQQSSGRAGTLVSCFVPLPSLIFQWAGLFGGTTQSRGPVYPLCRPPNFSQLDFPFPHILQAPALLGASVSDSGCSYRKLCCLKYLWKDYYCLLWAGGKGRRTFSQRPVLVIFHHCVSVVDVPALQVKLAAENQPPGRGRKWWSR